MNAILKSNRKEHNKRVETGDKKAMHKSNNKNKVKV
jgi:hypothetical protein